MYILDKITVSETSFVGMSSSNSDVIRQARKLLWSIFTLMGTKTATQHTGLLFRKVGCSKRDGSEKV
jgi:hypothetical protein